jgi:hypothetical protein
MAKKVTQKNGKTLEQKEAYHKAQLKRIEIGKQIKTLRDQQKALK